MISEFIRRAQSGERVYIHDVRAHFESLSDAESWNVQLVLTLLDGDKQRHFPLRLAKLGVRADQDQFVREYAWASIYNILSSLGGVSMDVYIDQGNQRLVEFVDELNQVFGVDLSRKDRVSYGRSLNVIDRMLETLKPDAAGFRFFSRPLDQLPPMSDSFTHGEGDPEVFRRVTTAMDGKLLCGIDVGGTDIKIVSVYDGKILAFKEYDWFPAQFLRSIQLVDPICLIVRLMRAQATLVAHREHSRFAELSEDMAAALEVSADERHMVRVCEEVERVFADDMAYFDGVGMCFPDVVVRDKIVGGEVYKTRGIRLNPDIEYESDFRQLTNLNDRIRALIRPGGAVNIVNDGPMASFTAAVELAASGELETVASGVYAHTLGTELGTGWVREDGTIPDIPLEVYNFIIDLGSHPERAYDPDDLRSINNFNTGLPGTLQKCTSQSGVFRLAMDLFPKERPDLYQELVDRGFVVEGIGPRPEGLYVPTAPKDLRKPFLEFMMELPEREQDGVNHRLWTEIGEYLAVTWNEARRILQPAADSIYLFGRLVKRKECFDLMLEGAQRIVPDIRLEIADAGLANTPLMKQLEADPHYTVAQFAQAIGAVYFANQ